MSGERLALVGYGGIAGKHLEVFRALGAQVVAACNRSQRGRERAQREGGVPCAYADPAEMIAAERPAGVLVCVNVLSLFEVTRALIPLGVPLLVEKPPGVSPGETAELAALAEACDTPVMVGLNRRFYSVYHRALQRLGGREAVTGVWVEWSEDPARMLQLGHPPALLPLLNFANSLHGIDLLPFFGGRVEVARVWGRNLDPTGSRLRWQMSLDGLGEGGAVVHFASSWDVPGRWRLVVDAADARMVSAPLETATVLARGAAPETVEPSPEDVQFKPGFFGQAEHFLAVIRGERPVGWPACSLREAVVGMELAARLTEACAG